MSDKMLEVKRKLKAKNSQKKQLEIWKASISNLSDNNDEAASVGGGSYIVITRNNYPPNFHSSNVCENFYSGEKVDVPQEKSELEPWLIEEMDNAISEAFLKGTEESMMQLLHIILSENVSPDYQVSLMK